MRKNTGIAQVATGPDRIREGMPSLLTSAAGRRCGKGDFFPPKDRPVLAQSNFLHPHFLTPKFMYTSPCLRRLLRLPPPHRAMVSSAAFIAAPLLRSSLPAQISVMDQVLRERSVVAPERPTADDDAAKTKRKKKRS